MAFQQGISGLNAASKDLDVIGNNIANVDTYGEKVSRAEFADIYANTTVSSTNSQVGIGTMLATVSQQFTQGTITTTDNPLDVAISGNGFFEVKGNNGLTEYTRNGQFKSDNLGFIVNDQGQKLMGYPADASGIIIPGTATALQLPTAGIAPATSTKSTMSVNLDSTGAVTLPTSGTPINFSDPTTYNNATSQTVYDVKGQPVQLTYYFQKAATDTWNVYVAANGTPITTSGGNPAPTTTMTFPTNGSAPTAPVGTVALNIPSVTNASGAATVPISNIALDLSDSTEFGAQFAVNNQTQDGYSAGTLSGVSFSANGVVTATYSNGQTKPAGQLEMANFRNPQGLAPTGGNSWTQTVASGAPIVGVAGAGNLGVLQAGALEESNVDLTQELVHMITAQRDYQANAQTIKTQDQIMQTIVNLR